MKKYLFLPVILFISISHKSVACTSCNRTLHDSIYDDNFYLNILIILSAFFVISIIVVALAFLSQRRYNQRVLRSPHLALLSPVPLTTVGMLLGIGLGGFADGIVLHQILQWHEMLSNRIAANTYIGKSVNMFWDGIFHAYCLVVVLTGVILLWKLLGRKDAERSGHLLAGGMLAGWGLFNIVEGLIDHHLLKLHNVMENANHPETANYIFLGASLIMIVTGYLIIRYRKPKSLTDNTNYENISR